RVDPDEQDVAELSGRAQVANVTDVEQIEAAVGQHDALALGPEAVGQRNRLVKRQGRAPAEAPRVKPFRCRASSRPRRPRRPPATRLRWAWHRPPAPA